LLLDECFCLPLSPFPPTMVLRKNVHGMVPSMYAGFNLTDTWMDES
jgi:hypothetical protein